MSNVIDKTHQGLWARRKMTTSFIKSVSISLAALVLTVAHVASGAQRHAGAAALPSQFPYGFTNFVWWTDSELRNYLKSRIPELGDRIPLDSPMKDSIREALSDLLKKKGITAEIQSVEPSSFEFTSERVPGAPAPSIWFSILSPKILVNKLTISGAPVDIGMALGDKLRHREGSEFLGNQDWLVRSDVEEELQSKGYLDGKVDIAHDAPRQVGDHFVVNLLITVACGPQYRIGSLSADGGPLLRGRDLSPYFTQKPGDVAGSGPFGTLAAQISAVYRRYGYVDVEVNAPPIFDRPRATVSYHLTVDLGPVFHLRRLAIHNLDAQQEREVRKLFGLRPGDVFNEMEVNRLYDQISADPLLAGKTFTFSPKKDKSAAQIDLTLNFGKAGGEGVVRTE